MVKIDPVIWSLQAYLDAHVAHLMKRANTAALSMDEWKEKNKVEDGSSFSNISSACVYSSNRISTIPWSSCLQVELEALGGGMSEADMKKYRETLDKERKQQLKKRKKEKKEAARAAAKSLFTPCVFR